MLSDQDKAIACEQIARLTSGFSGAELANVVNEAALLTGRDGRKVRNLACIFNLYHKQAAINSFLCIAHSGLCLMRLH